MPTDAADCFHTVEDKDNLDYVLNNAPFKCTKRNAWLTHGYYFWYSDLRIAKAWKAPNNVVLQFKLKFFRLFDLVGEPTHLELFRIACQKVRKKRSDARVPDVIQFLRQTEKLQPGAFPFDSIKVDDEDDGYARDRVYFEGGRDCYMRMSKRIQICLFEKDTKHFITRAIVVHPPTYCNPT